MQTVSQDTQTKVMKMYLDGQSSKEIAKETGLTPKKVSYMVKNPQLKLETEKKFFALDKARENRKISEVKNEILDFYKDALQELKKKKGKVSFAKETTQMLNEIDRISRLNAGEVTEKTESTNKNVEYDVSKLMEQLDTDEEKKNFLKKQIK